ncbi:hypothetical protein Syun_024587 [Stephania yunnanensis]|uniref:Uncharacterized protein n=1 Tax=Stephania yunnanensis TaxID=152371 RepID=A0AAP0I4M1_9MAGN
MHFCVVRVFVESIPHSCAFWKSEDEIGAMTGLGGEVDAHPYISFTIDIS